MVTLLLAPIFGTLAYLALYGDFATGRAAGLLSTFMFLKLAAALRDFEPSVFLPGIKINTGPENFQPIKQMRLVQFDGRTWQPIGDVIESAFSGVPKN